MDGVHIIEDESVPEGEIRVAIDDPDSLSSRVFGVRYETIKRWFDPRMIDAEFVVRDPEQDE